MQAQDARPKQINLSRRIIIAVRSSVILMCMSLSVTFVTQAQNALPAGNSLFPFTHTSDYKQKAAAQKAAEITATQKQAHLKTTNTETANILKAASLAKYKPFGARELISHYYDHNGENIIISGRVFNVQNRQALQMYVGGEEDAVTVHSAEPFSDIENDEYVTVYGTVHGVSCGTNAAGAQICQPLIDIAFISK